MAHRTNGPDLEADDEGLVLEPRLSMSTPARRVIEIHRGSDTAIERCSAAEPFALRVLGGSMRPEFDDGDIIVVEPEGHATDGSFVVAHCNGEWMLRQLRADGASWRLATLDGGCGDIAIPDLAAVAGVVIQKAKPGRRRAGRRYVE
jgi:hypothetical protein